MVYIKPIFKEEKGFLEEQLSIVLPEYCWKDKSYIILNHDSKEKLVHFKVENGILKLDCNKILKIEDNKIDVKTKTNVSTLINYTWEQEYLQEQEYIKDLETESILRTTEYIEKFPDHKKRVGISGGKDSDVMFIMFKKALKKAENKEYTIDVYNTSNDTGDTYRHIKMELGIGIQDIHSPKKGIFQWLKEDKNYFLPTKLVRNCCSTYKEGQVKKILDKNEKYISFMGMRKFESTKRSFYDWDMNEAYKKNGMKLDIPENWKRFLPIVNWRDEDVWLYIIHNNIKVNKMYFYGFNRCGCLICPFQSDYTDLLIKKYYPQQWKRWEEMLKKNYELWNVERRLKFTIDEWLNGAWKVGTSKEYDIITQKPTKARIKELAELKGMSEEIAERYFQRKCSCGKKLNSDEIAMFLKTNGRFEGLEDNRKYLCKKCFCEKEGINSKEYAEKVMRFREQGCHLF